MKTPTLLLALSTLFFASTSAQVQPHIHRRDCAASNTASAAPPPATTPLPSTLVTSVSASASPPAASPPPAAPSSSAGAGAETGKSVTIAPGDTLEKIAAANAVGICDLAKANNIKDPNVILAGAVLKIPVLKGVKDDRSCLH
jgi:LysM repeat protein